jgi:hypothetical protein
MRSRKLLPGTPYAIEVVIGYFGMICSCMGDRHSDKCSTKVPGERPPARNRHPAATPGDLPAGIATGGVRLRAGVKAPAGAQGGDL